LPAPDDAAGVTHYITQTRAIRPSDATAAAAWIARDFPVPRELADGLAKLLRRLIAQDILRGAVVEDRSGAKSLRQAVAALGLTGFLSNERAARYLDSPSPHFELALLDEARRDGGKGPFLDHDDIARANAGDGLTAFPLLWLQRSSDPQAPDTRALLMASQRSFLTVHRGYNLFRILKETTADRADAFVAGGFRERGRIAAGTPLQSGGGRLRGEHVVFEANRNDFEQSMPGAAIGPLFMYRPPRCGFTRPEQQVLESSLDHQTDNDIAAELDISAPAVAMRWRSIYARVTAQVPSVLRAGPNASPSVRGKEKRRRIVAFVDDHPEEIRPYAQA